MKTVPMVMTVGGLLLASAALAAPPSPGDGEATRAWLELQASGRAASKAERPMDGDAADFGGVHAGFDAQHRRLGKSGRCVGARTAHSMEQSDREREKRRIDCRTPGCDHDYTIVNPNQL